MNTLREHLNPGLRAMLSAQHDQLATQLGHDCHIDASQRQSASARLRPSLDPRVRARLQQQHANLASTLDLDCAPEHDYLSSPGGMMRLREPKDQGVRDYEASGSASAQQPGARGTQLSFERPNGRESARRPNGVITESLLAEFTPESTSVLTEDTGDPTGYLGNPAVDSRRKRWAISQALQPFLGEDSASHQLPYYDAQPVGEMAMDSVQRRVHARTLAEAMAEALPHGGRLL